MTEEQPDIRIVTDEEINADGKFITMPGGSESKARKEKAVSGEANPNQVLQFPIPKKSKPSSGNNTSHIAPSLGGQNKF